MKRKTSTKSWGQIGKMIGEKVEKEFKSKEYKPWMNWQYYYKKHEDGFFGRLLFIIGVLIVLNQTGTLQGISIWVQILIGAGFAFMRF